MEALFTDGFSRALQPLPRRTAKRSHINIEDERKVTRLLNFHDYLNSVLQFMKHRMCRVRYLAQWVQAARSEELYTILSKFQYLVGMQSDLRNLGSFVHLKGLEAYPCCTCSQLLVACACTTL